MSSDSPLRLSSGSRVRRITQILRESSLRLNVVFIAEREELARETEADAESERESQITARLESRGDKVNEDANAYYKQLQENTTFDVCAICGVEESSNQLVSMSDTQVPPDYLSKLRSGYRSLLAIGGVYASAVEQAFDENGNLRSCSWYCKRCVSAMYRRSAKTGTCVCKQTIVFLLMLVTCDLR